MNPWCHNPTKSTGGTAADKRSEFVDHSTWLTMGILSIQTITCPEDMHDTFTVTSSSSAIPRRNLADAFEQHVEPAVSTTPAAKQLLSEEESPVGVADLQISDSQDDDSLPHFYLHADLKRDLSQALVNRVSFYGVLHDINKEATAMAENDFLSFRRVKSTDEAEEIFSPLVVAVNGKPSRSRQALSMTETALIDEEQWILSAIEARDDNRAIADCPPTFLQAIGEREYDRLETTRTQLWKPSRSWWEAKSGKNPWIEPKSHNKRWRYLWPLIHYHKFLAKCIKKLKRNGVDVKVSVSPVAVFLREEVCAVSDHLAAVSLFTSERWMECLAEFEGWTDPNSEPRLRKLIEGLKLRPLDEPGDVDSPLLRSQIDEQFLRAMAAARESMSGGAPQQAKKLNTLKTTAVPHSVETDATAPSSRHGLPLHPQRYVGEGIPPQLTTPRGKSRMRSNGAPQPVQTNQTQSSKGDGSTASRGASYIFHNGQWWGNGWAPHFAVCDENTSVHSALSGDSYLFGYPPSHYDPNFHGMFPMPFYHQQAPEQSMTDVHPASAAFYPQNFDPYNNPEHSLAAYSGWYGHDPNAVHGNTPSASSAPSTPQDATGQNVVSSDSDGAPGEQHTPYHVDYSHGHMSPFWGPMDYHMHQTLAHAGIMTPQKGPPPSTPHRTRKGEDDKNGINEIEAQPLLLAHNAHYHPFRQMYNESYMPPSPATQFMMSPQANAQAAAYYAAYNQGGIRAFHGSPARSSARRRTKRTSPTNSVKKMQDHQMIPPPAIRNIAEKASAPEESSDSELTAATAAESESVAG